jgi:tRNA A37 threonylcarbamoyladenosine dehydratase
LTELIDSTQQFERRFASLSRLYGVQGAKAIASAHVVVVGIGGVGSWAVEALARSGVGELTIIDLDHISESNINRQIHALSDTLGMSKVLAMKNRVQQINPDCKVNCVDDFVTPENWLEIVKGFERPEISGLIDACDQASAKLTMSAWSAKRGTEYPGFHFITVGAAGGKRWAQKVDIADLSKVTHDPLLAQLRNKLRRDFGLASGGKNMGVHCVFSAEGVKMPDLSCDAQSDGSLNCHGYGSSVSVTSTFGQCAAGWICDQIAQSVTKK